MFRRNKFSNDREEAVTVRLPWRNTAWITAVATLLATIGSCLLQFLAALSGLWYR